MTIEKIIVIILFNGVSLTINLKYQKEVLNG